MSAAEPANGTTDAMGRHIRVRALAFLIFLQFFYSWAWSSSDVLRPAFRAALQMTLTEVGAGYSAQVVGGLAGALVIVRFEHRVGRRHSFALLAAGIGLSLLSGVVVADWGAFLVQRFAVGVFGGAVFPLTIGLIADLFERRYRGRLASLIDGTYFAAVVALGLVAGQVGIAGWRSLLWLGGVPPLLFAAAAYRCIPEYVAHGVTVPAGTARASITHLFGRAYRSRTLALSTMMGANACGSQAFSGWLTTYLYEVAHFSGYVVGAIVACQFFGSMTGCIGWGWMIDRFGRRVGAAGLLASGVTVAVFLLAPPSPVLLAMLAGVFGLAFSAVVSLGPWLVELYPPELRTAATSMFQWGRFISLLAPVVTGSLAVHWGLPAAMGLSVAAFVLAAAIWWRLPETLVRR